MHNIFRKRNFILTTVLLFVLFTGFIVAAILNFKSTPKNIPFRTETCKSDPYLIVYFGGTLDTKNFPVFLQEILDESSRDRIISIIDKSFKNSSSSYILNQLPHTIEKYEPDMVIVMAGINDLKAKESFREKKIYHESTFRSLIRIKRFYLDSLRRRIEKLINTQQTAVSDKSPLEYYEKRFPDRSMNKFYETQNKFKRALILNPHNHLAYISLGILYRDWHQLNRAEAAFMKATELVPDDYRVYLEQGILYRVQGRFSKAESAFIKAAEINPGNYRVFFERGLLCLERGLYEVAGEFFRKAVSLNPNSYRANVQSGIIAREMKKYEDAESLFLRAIKLNHNEYRALLELGLLYKKWERPIEAEMFLKRAVELYPVGHRLYLERSTAYRNRGRIEEAEGLLEIAIKIIPETLGPHLELGILYRNQGRFSEAEELILNFKELIPEYYMAYAELGWLYWRRGRFEEAELLFKKALQSNPELSRAYFEKGRLYETLGRLAEAKIALRKAVSLNPENEQAYLALDKLFSAPNPVEFINGEEPDITVKNYKSIKTKLANRGIVFICMQNPMLNIESFKSIFESDCESVIFIDSGNIFWDALKDERNSDYLIDTHRWKFEHRTAKGQRALAEYVAGVILKIADSDKDKN